MLGDSIAQGIASYGPHVPWVSIEPSMECRNGEPKHRQLADLTGNADATTVPPGAILAAVGINDIPDLREHDFELRAGQNFD